jgi:hypothetical protein
VRGVSERRKSDGDLKNFRLIVVLRDDIGWFWTFYRKMTLSLKVYIMGE